MRLEINLRTENGFLIDDQTTYIMVQLKEFDLPFEELKTDFDKLLYTMKYTEEETKEALKKGEKTPTELWIQEVLEELYRSNLSIDERADLEKSIAEEASKRREMESNIKKRMEAEVKAKNAEIKAKNAEAKAENEKKLRIAQEVKAKKEKIESVKELLKNDALSDERIQKIMKISAKELAKIRSMK